MLERRKFLNLLVSALVLAAASPVVAKDGGGDGGGHGGGHDGGGHDGQGHDGGDDNGGDHGKGKGKNGRDDDGVDQDEALREVRDGRIIALKTALKIVDARMSDANMSGKVIDVRLTRSMGRSQYRFKVRGDNGAISTIRLDAKTGSFVGRPGF